MALSHLHFFDSQGNDITPLQDNGVYKLTIPFERVSTGLFSSAHLFVLEEILKEYEGNQYNLKKKGTYTPLIIRIMKFLDDAGSPVKEKTLHRFFSIFKQGTDAVSNFLQSNNTYIDAYFDGSDTYYSLTNYGISHLREYEQKEEDTYLDNYRRIPELVRPRSNYDVEQNEDTYFLFRWKPTDDKYDKNIFVYYIDNHDDTIYYENEKSLCLDKGEKLPSIVPVYNENLLPDAVYNEQWKKWFLPYRFDDGREDGFQDYNDNNTWDTMSRRIIGSDRVVNQKPFQFNFALISETEGTFVRTLDLFLVRTTNTPAPTTENPNNTKSITNMYQVAEITFFGEVVGEDERLRLLLENFGRNIDEADAYVFRDVDVQDDRPDYIALNQKRKELLLVGEEIYPYLGSYKAFVNAMKFFGYQDLRLKEYFVNLRLSNPSERTIYYTAIEIPLDLKTQFDFQEDKDFNELLFGSIINNKIYQKTSRFGLYYDLNRVTDETDELGFPIVEDVYVYTNEEILLKLYGLKRVLQKYFLPHHARIVDITGEGVYFAKYKISSWADKTPIIPLRIEDGIKFDVYPKSAYIKPLDKLLNIFRKEIEGLDESLEFVNDQKLNNISDKILYEFIDGGEIDYEFDTSIDIDLVRSFYPNYWELKKAIYYHLKNATCPAKYDTSDELDHPYIIEKVYNTETQTYIQVPRIINQNYKEDLSKSLEYSLRLLGLPVLLKTTIPLVVWDDMTVTFDMLESDTAPYDPSDTEVQRISEEEEYFGILGIPDERLNGNQLYLRRLIRGGSKLVTWDNVGFYLCNWLEWNIKHENQEYCYKTTGTFADKANILVFLPAVGKYDITLVARDVNNFPRIYRQPAAVEVLNNQPDFVALGRFIKRETLWDEFLDTTWDEFNGVWDYGTYCYKETTWDDSKLTWDDLNYATYKLENYTESDICRAPILNYDENLYKIVLSGRDYGISEQKYGTQKWRNNIVLQRDPEEVPSNNGINLREVSNKKIILDGIYQIKSAEKINIYKYYKTDKFVIHTDDTDIAKIIIETDYYEAFQVGNMINLIDATDKSRQSYVIKSTTADFVKNLMTLEIENDGSLNYYAFHWIEFRGDNYIFKVVSSMISRINNTTTLMIEDADSKTREIIKKGIMNFRAEWGIYSGEFVFNVVDFEFVNDTTIIRVEPNENMCHIDSTFVAQWAEDYDYNYVERYSTVRNYTFDNYDTVTWDNSGNQTFDMMEFHNQAILGFKIQEIIKPWFWIELNGTKLSVDIPNYIDRQFRMHYLCHILNTSKLENFKDFTYTLVMNDYIQAIYKYGGPEGYMSIKYSPHIIGETNTYPKANFKNWETKYFNGYNNPATWNYLKYNEQNDDKFWATSGAFNFTDTFIAYHDFEAPILTPIFIKYMDTLENKYDLEYSWELWEETRNKLLMRSKKPYMMHTFINNGIYSVKLQTIDKKGNIRNYEKKSWIRVV